MKKTSTDVLLLAWPRDAKSGLEAKFYGLGLEGPGLGLKRCTEKFLASPSNTCKIAN